MSVEISDEDWETIRDAVVASTSRADEDQIVDNVILQHRARKVVDKIEAERT